MRVAGKCAVLLMSVCVCVGPSVTDSDAVAGSDTTPSQTGQHSTESQTANGSLPQGKQPNAVSSVLATLAKPVKGALGKPASAKQKAEHVV